MVDRIYISGALFAIVIALIFSGCDSANEERLDSDKVVYKPAIDSLTFMPVKGDTLRFSAPFRGSYATSQSYIDDGQTYWVGLIPSQYRLEFFSLDSKTPTQSIDFESEGPNGVKGYIDGFFYHNADSIFLLSIEAKHIYLMNDKAEQVDLFDFRDLTLPDGFAEYDVYANDGFLNGPHYVPSNKTIQFYTYRWNTDLEDNMSQQVFASFSIIDRVFVSIYGLYPDNYKKGENYSFYNDPVLAVVDTLSFVQFGASEYLAAYSNVSGKLLYASNEHCEHWPGSPEPVGSYDLEESGDWLVEQAAYPVLLHDEKNELIYRFLKHTQPLQDDSRSFWFGPFCISMYDYGLKRLGHYELPANTFLPVLAFAAKGDVWINNPVRPEDENTSLFYRLKLSKKADPQ